MFANCKVDGTYYGAVLVQFEYELLSFLTATLTYNPLSSHNHNICDHNLKI